MEISVTRVPVTTARQTFTIHHLTDLHRDDSDHAEKELAARVAEIQEDPFALWIGGGDYGSLILPNDPRFSTSRTDTAHRLPDRYIESMDDLIRPIKSKCLGLGTGNHEATIGKYYHRGVVPELASRLNIQEKYLGVRGWCVVVFEYGERRLPLKCFQYHGWSAGRLKGRKALQAERDLGAWNADAFFLGHDHQPYSDVWYTEECRGTKKGYQITQRPRAYINGGSWTYGQRPPMPNKESLKISEFPNEAWVEGRNFRPQPPVSPVLLVHVDFGTSNHRPSGLDFETRMRAPTFHIGEAA